MSRKNRSGDKIVRKPEEIRERSEMIRGMVCRFICIAIFVTALVLTWTTAWQVSSHLLDSDASSELILAEKLAREGGIVSSTWKYSTELRVLYNQIVYSLLFRITSDWSLVRFLGTVILHCLMLGAYAYLARQTRMKVNAFLLTAAAMVLPFSVPYGRIVLYHTYYITHVILTMWMVGLWLSALRHLRVWQDERRAGIKAEGGRIFRTLLPAILLGLVAFASGLGGIRMILICAAPLVASALLWGMTGENGSDEPTPFRLPLVLALGMAVCCLGGYLVNSRVLARIYSFSDFSVQTISLASVTGLEEILRGFLTALGFSEKLELFTVQGLLSIGSAVALLIVLMLSFHTIRHTKDPCARFIQIYMLMGLLCVTCVFVFLSEGQWLYCLYYLPLLFWILPALGKMEIDCPPENYRPKAQPAEEEEKKPAKHGRMPAVLFPGSTGAPTRMGRLLGVGDGRITAHGLLALLCCLVLIGNGVFYTGFFRDPASLSDKVVYSGLNYIDPFTVEGLQPVADYLKNEGYTLCYAAYWDAAVITELTDGKVRSVPIAEGSRRKVIQYMDWLTDAKLYDPEYCRQQKACLVIQEEMYHFIEADEKLLSNMREAASFNGYTVYELKDPAVIAEYLD